MIRKIVYSVIIAVILSIATMVVMASHSVDLTGLTAIAGGGQVTLNASFLCPGIGDFYMEVEIVPSGNGFTGTPTHESTARTEVAFDPYCNSPVTPIQFNPLTLSLDPGTYSWRARMRRDTIPCCAETITTGNWASGPDFIITIGGVPGIPPAFNDNRINNYDFAAPVAVYRHEVGDEVGLIIYDPDGVVLLIVTPAQIAIETGNPSSAVLLAEGNGVSVYRIPGEDRGHWQINAPQYNGKTYVLIFSELYANSGYVSYEVD